MRMRAGFSIFVLLGYDVEIQCSPDTIDTQSTFVNFRRTEKEKELVLHRCNTNSFLAFFLIAVT